ncbi:MAG TPA: DUF456 domain-containing protein [Gemmatimonadaceae bacterium]|jgi:uncharacterized protein YqgC (DUF456 family)|nr:DUF456 domain-containing protein [Gemmatimonadaceae bacterium]
MQVLLLIAAIVLGLIMIPFGMPGTLVMFAAALCYHLLVPGGGIGLATVIGVGVLMAVAEGLEWVLTSRFTKKYGGSRRAGWGAVIGGMVGAFMGVPIPIVGSIVGAFAGAFIGAFVFEWSRERNHGVATRVAWGALIGRVVAAAIKVAIGLTMAAWMVWAVLL